MRKEGQVIKSKDLVVAMSLILMFFFLQMYASVVWVQLTKIFTLLYEQIPNKHIEDIGMANILFIVIVPTFLILAPIFFVAMLIPIIGDLAQIGPLVTGKPLVPDMKRLNPLAGLKIYFSP